MGLEHFIVVDGGSHDQTKRIASEYGALVVDAAQGRASQMNAGANLVSDGILWFIHADTLPPKSGAVLLLEAVNGGADLGCFRFEFNSERLILKVNSFMTRFNFLGVRGGDQGIFMRCMAFKELNGFDEKYVIMEEYDLLERASQAGLAFRLLPASMLVSARKYDHNSYFKVNWANLKAFKAYKRGEAPEAIAKAYHEMLHHPTDSRKNSDERSSSVTSGKD